MVREFLFLPGEQQVTYPLREDLRCEISKQQLVGWTVDIIKSILPELILKYSNREEFMEALKDKSILQGKDWKTYLKQVIEDPEMKLKDDLSKALDEKYKEKISNYTKDMKYKEVDKLVQPYRQRIKQFFSDPNNKALCQTKAPEPHEWIKVRGKVGPGETGATAELPGFFCGIDHGTVEFLAQKSYMHEYYFHGEVFNGKYIFRLLARTKKWQKTGRKRQVWMLWRTKNNDLPYVLKKRAVDQGWMPPPGKSALPKHIRDQIPKGYEYWKAKGSKAKQLRDKLSSAIRKKEVTIKTLKEMLEANEKFQFKRLWWRGPTIVRGMPQIFYVLIFHDKTIHHAWYFTENILHEVLNDLDSSELEDLSIEDFFKEYCPIIVERLLEKSQTIPLDEGDYEDNKLIQAEGEFPPEHSINPNKELPLHFDTLDKGEAIRISEEKGRFYRYKLKGRKLKGVYVLIRQSPKSKMWYFSKAELPKPEETVQEHFLGESQFVLHKHYGEVPIHWDIRILAGQELLEFNLVKDPYEMAKNETAAGGRKYCPDLTWFILDGNGVNKLVGDTPTKIDVLDRGKVSILSNDEMQSTFLLKGERVQGYFKWSKADGTITRLSTTIEPEASVVEGTYAPVPPSGKRLGNAFKPTEVVDSFDKPINLSEAFIFLANPDRITKGDIDIFIRAPTAVLPEEDYSKMSREELIEKIEYFKQQVRLFDDWYNRAIYFRLVRAVKARHPELVDRLDIRNDMRGPFTNHKPLYDLVLAPSEEKRTIRMSREYVEDSIREAFRWARRYDLVLDRSSKKGETWIRGEALFPKCSLNKRCYSREEIEKMARTAIGKPIMVNHGEPPYEGLEIGKIEDSEEEGGKLEFLAKITDEYWAKRIRHMKPRERLLSIGANPRENVLKQGREYPEGLVIEEISILVPPARPGVPDARYQVNLNGWH